MQTSRAKKPDNAEPRASRLRGRVALWVGGAVWLFLIGAGVRAMVRYEKTPGVAANAPSEWPPASRLVRDGQRDTLVMFVHPKCSCSRASLEELRIVTTRAGADVRSYVVFLGLVEAPSVVEASALWRSVETIPNATRMLDLDGHEAKVFGARTSGQVAMYDRAGLRTFQGGITGSRGHAGENAGRESVLAMLTNQPAAFTATDVFGCSLWGAPRRAMEFLR